MNDMVDNSLKAGQYLLDVLNDNNELTEALGGENIEITGGGKSHINLFDIDLSYGDNSISDK